ncbi:MAG: ABC transporter substrate-binding protein [Oscillospiraceae bacterium]|nr:ABC transporter substrate-binding protein [Oscillospiraceae bacterium]
MFTGCSSETDAVEEEEETEVQTLTVADEEYYKRFYDDGISINVYNWGEYISDGSDEGTLNVNAEFTKLTGIKVNYTNYATNEELYAKLKGGGASYDIIIPSDYMISRMIKEEMILPLDMNNIPNYKYIGEAYKNQAFDPENEYSVPYFWGTVGIIYDTTLIEEENIDWDILWNEDYADRILMFDNPRDAFAIAELRLGYSLNTEDEKELEAAAELLKEQKKVVQAYVMDEIFDKMGAGEALIAPYYAGDAVTLMAEYEDLGFVIPESGTNLFIDGICIPKGAKQKEAAEMYINFLCEPDIAYSNTYYVGYSTPNTAAYEMLDEETKNDGISYLPDEYLMSNTTVFRNLSDEANQKMQDLWTELKSTQDQTKNKWIVPVFMLACVILSITILIMRYIKKKKDIF